MLTLIRPRVPAGLRPRTVRLRLTALYGALFAVSGAILLAITYLLVRHATGPRRVIYRTGQIGPVTSGGGIFLKRPLPPDLQRLTTQLDAEVARHPAHPGARAAGGDAHRPRSRRPGVPGDVGARAGHQRAAGTPAGGAPHPGDR